MLGAKWKAEMCWLITKKAFDPRRLPFHRYQYMPCASLMPQHSFFQDQFPCSFTHTGVKIHLSCTVSRQFGPGPYFIDSFYDVVLLYTHTQLVQGPVYFGQHQQNICIAEKCPVQPGLPRLLHRYLIIILVEVGSGKRGCRRLIGIVSGGDRIVREDRK